MISNSYNEDRRIPFSKFIKKIYHLIQEKYSNIYKQKMANHIIYFFGIVRTIAKNWYKVWGLSDVHILIIVLLLIKLSTLRNLRNSFYRLAFQYLWDR